MNKFRVTVSILCIVLSGIYIYAIVKSPLPYDVIDRDQSNLISLMEVMNSQDIGKRNVNAGGSKCIELYWLKDGLSAHLECNEHCI